MIRVMLLFILIVGGTTAAKHLKCFGSKAEVNELKLGRYQHRLPNNSANPPNKLPMTRVKPTSQSCSSFTHGRSSMEYSERSISPWSYRDDRDEERVPVVISVAECLCNGCIIDGKEDTSYNSVEVKQTRNVWKRIKCPTDPQKYTFELMTVEVPVGCTCVIPKSL